MSYYQYGRKSVKTWMNDKTRTKGASKYNAPLIRAYKTVSAEIARNNAMNYFLLTKCGVTDVRSMLHSGMKQRKLVYAVIMDLKHYAVTDEYFNVFKNDLNLIYERCQWVFNIMRENLKLTEYYPYFENGGFEKLIEFSFKPCEEGVEDSFFEEIELYNKEHADEIEAYMKAVQPDIERRDRHRAKIEADRKAEIQTAKDLRKATMEELKEMKKHQNEYAKRKRLIEKEMETTLRRV